MAKLLHRENATWDISPVISQCGLAITEYLDQCVWSIDEGRNENMTGLCRTLFDEAPRPGLMLAKDSLRWLQPGPDRAYLLSRNAPLPSAALPFEAGMTDISHGVCELGLRGESALDFIAAHCSADLHSPRIADQRNLRCLFGRYTVTIWWDQHDDLRLLVDRSQALSLCHFLETLGQRWQDFPS